MGFRVKHDWGVLVLCRGILLSISGGSRKPWALSYREEPNSDHSPSWQFWCLPASFLIQNCGCVISGYYGLSSQFSQSYDIVALYLLDIKVALNPLYVVEVLLSLWKCTQTMFPALWISLGKLVPHIGLARTAPKTPWISIGLFGSWKYASLISR